MLLNILLIIALLLPFILIYLSKRWNFLSKKYKYIEMAVMIISIFLGAFLAIKLSEFQSNNEEKRNLVSSCEAAKYLAEELKSRAFFIYEKIDNEPLAYFNSFKSIERANEPILLNELIKNPLVMKHSSKVFKWRLPFLILEKESIDLTIRKDNKLEFLFFIYLQDLEINTLTNEIDFLNDVTNEDKVNELNSKLLENFYEKLNLDKVTLDSLIASLNDSQKVLYDSLKVLKVKIDSLGKILKVNKETK